MITLELVVSAMKRLEVDEQGFDEMDRRLLLLIIDKFEGGPVGIETLAAALSEEKDTIEDVYEPYLIQEGFLDRTPRGRQATRLSYEYWRKNHRRGAPSAALPVVHGGRKSISLKLLQTFQRIARLRKGQPLSFKATQ
jgi:hypothetical protein